MPLMAPHKCIAHQHKEVELRASYLGPKVRKLGRLVISELIDDARVSY